MGEENKEVGSTNGGTEEKKEEKMENQEREDEIIVLKVDMHCDACAKKVVRVLKGFQGVEDIAVDRKTNKVVVKGKIAEPTKLCERVQKKSGRKVEIVSPLPSPPEQQLTKDGNKDESSHGVTNDQPQQVITVVLRVGMHCEACAQIMRKRISKIKGVESVEVDVSKDQVRVKGVIGDPATLAKYVTKRTRKQASVTAVEDQLEKKDHQLEAAEKKQSEANPKEDDQLNETNEGGIDDKMKSQLHVSRSYDYYWPTNSYSNMDYNYTSSNYQQPQIFSDENPNACSIM